MSVAVNKAAKTGVPSSTFATLLRRSKFASYDPCIGQLYTAHGGSAARGDFGLKRPLAVRKRGARLAVQKLDTLYQQTEWTDGFSDNHFLRKFEEMGVTPEVDKDMNWARHVGVTGTVLRNPWLQDSDYVDKIPGKLETELLAGQPTPNPHSMNARRFERFLRRVQKLQPKFENFLAEEEGTMRRTNPISMSTKEHTTLPLHRRMNTSPRDHLRFLANEFARSASASDSTVLCPIPHPVAGITYTHSGELQTSVNTKPIPGRLLDRVSDRKSGSPVAIASAAGWVGKCPLSNKEKGQANISSNILTDFGWKDGEPRTNAEAGKAMFRPTVKIMSPPHVVGTHPDRIGNESFEMEFIKSPHPAVNTYIPGSREYVGLTMRVNKTTTAPRPLYHQERSHFLPKFSSLDRIVPQKDRKEETAQASDLLQRLKLMVKPKEGKEDGELP